MAKAVFSAAIVGGVGRNTRPLSAACWAPYQRQHGCTRTAGTPTAPGAGKHPDLAQYDEHVDVGWLRYERAFVGQKG